jgi:hypothetical protein
MVEVYNLYTWIQRFCHGKPLPDFRLCYQNTLEGVDSVRIYGLLEYTDGTH